MTNDKQPIVVKKYANRRLYNTGTSSYVTLEDLALMVKKGDDFVVFDAKSGDDITRSVLAQIIFEQEGKAGQSLLPITFLRQLIRFYGDSMQMLVPSYLEFSIDKLMGEQQKLRDQMTGNFATEIPGRQLFGALEEQTRKNMAMFTQALAAFTPFGAAVSGMSDPLHENSPAAAPESPKADQADLDEMKKQLQEMQKQLDGLTSKS